jgi:hypothetical protein
MNIIFNLLIFCLVLFFYLHIYFHLKTSDDLEIYEIEQPSKDRLEEICDLRQPVLFELNILENCQRSSIRDTYGAFDIKIRNVQSEIVADEELFIPLAFSSALKALEEDTSAKYLVEANGDFLDETGLIKSYKYNDAFLRPYMVSNCLYDFLMAAKDTVTPFRYDLNYRNYYLVTEGEIKVKLSPPKSSRYLYQVKDYENMEFRSPINPWKVQVQYKPDFDKIKCLELTIKKGYVLFVPAFWWCSIKFSGENTSICSLKYRTYMNNVAIFDKIAMKFLQSQNVKRNTVKQIVSVGQTSPSEK